jgi:hypothetical protein
MERISEFKETSDVDLAGYLLLKGFKLVPPIKKRGRYVIFTFNNSPQLEAEQAKYFNQDTSVDALTLCQSIRVLRTQVRETRMQGGDF